MKKPICTIMIECTEPTKGDSIREWGNLRMSLVHYINRFEGCDVKYFGWEKPSPELHDTNDRQGRQR